MSSIVGSYFIIFFELLENVETGVDVFWIRFSANDRDVLFIMRYSAVVILSAVVSSD
jgi:hypothetical protein